MRIIAAFFIGSLIMVLPALAGKIAATVNDVPISNFDVVERTKLIRLQQPGEFNNLSAAAIQRRVLDMLIEKEVKKQAALKQGFSVSEADIQEAIRHLEQQNKMAVGDLAKTLTERGIALNTLTDQILADLLWLQVLQKNRTDAFEVSEAALKEKQEQIRKILAMPAAIVSEILVADEATIRTVAEGLKDSRFDDLARLYSIAPTKKEGGFVGEIGPAHYGAAVWAVLDKLGAGQLSDPIQTDKGWLIVAIHDKKAPLTGDYVDIWDVVQASFPLPFEAPIKGCDTFEMHAKGTAFPGSLQRGMVSPAQLPVPLKELLTPLKTGTLAGPVTVESGVMYFMKCEETQRKLVPSLEELKEQARLEQMALLSDKLLTGYKRLAVIVYH